MCRIGPTQAERALRKLCLQLQVCNSIEPELDILHDTTLADGVKPDS